MVIAVNGVITANVPVAIPGGRLTLTTLTPVLAATVSAATSVLYTPYNDNLCPVWNGSSFVMTPFSELSNVLANSSVGNAGPAAGAAAKVYDLFVWSNSGTPTLTRDVAWTNDTTPVAGGTGPRAGLNLVNGILVNANTITNGPAAGFGTYVGTIRTDAGSAAVSVNLGSAAATGGPAFIGLWNAYNRVNGRGNVQTTTSAWTYAVASWRQVENSAGWKFSVVRGLNEDSVTASYNVKATTANAGRALVSIGLDSTAAVAADALQGDIIGPTGLSAAATIVANYAGLPGLGVHALNAIEFGVTGTSTFDGSTVGSGMQVSIRY